MSTIGSHAASGWLGRAQCRLGGVIAGECRECCGSEGNADGGNPSVHLGCPFGHCGFGFAGDRSGQRVEVPTGEFTYDPQLSTVVPVRVPLSDAEVGAFVYAGPSSTAEVMCIVPPVPGLPSPGYSDHCVTNADGTLTLRYRVQAPDSPWVLRRLQGLEQA